jgi:hypothetical protein
MAAFFTKLPQFILGKQLNNILLSTVYMKLHADFQKKDRFQQCTSIRLQICFWALKEQFFILLGKTEKILFSTIFCY